MHPLHHLIARPLVEARQRELAALALSSERVADRILSRIEQHQTVSHSSVMFVSVDEYMTVAHHMTQLCGVAKELHGILAGGALSLDELTTLGRDLEDAATALYEAMEVIKQIGLRRLALPKDVLDSEGRADG